MTITLKNDEAIRSAIIVGTKATRPNEKVFNGKRIVEKIGLRILCMIKTIIAAVKKFSGYFTTSPDKKRDVKYIERPVIVKSFKSPLIY